MFNPEKALPPGILEGLIGSTTSLEPVGIGGDGQRGSCPFHLGTAASLHVANGTWYCFACRAGGDAMAWIMQRDGVDRSGALVALQAYLTGRA
jgi:DNA primase